MEYKHHTIGGVKDFNFKILLYSIKFRCENKKSLNYKHYGEKGIKCLLSIKDLEFLHLRDNVNNMYRPSIDRIDPKKDYVLNNCRFITLEDNIRRQGGVDMPTRKIPTSISIEENLYRLAENESKKEERSLNWVINKALEQYLNTTINN